MSARAGIASRDDESPSARDAPGGRAISAPSSLAARAHTLPRSANARPGVRAPARRPRRRPPRAIPPLPLRPAPRRRSARAPRRRRRDESPRRRSRARRATAAPPPTRRPPRRRSAPSLRAPAAPPTRPRPLRRRVPRARVLRLPRRLAAPSPRTTPRRGGDLVAPRRRGGNIGGGARLGRGVQVARFARAPNSSARRPVERVGRPDRGRARGQDPPRRRAKARGDAKARDPRGEARGAREVPRHQPKRRRRVRRGRRETSGRRRKRVAYARDARNGYGDPYVYDPRPNGKARGTTSFGAEYGGSYYRESYGDASSRVYRGGTRASDALDGGRGRLPRRPKLGAEAALRWLFTPLADATRDASRWLDEDLDEIAAASRGGGDLRRVRLRGSNRVRAAGRGRVYRRRRAGASAAAARARGDAAGGRPNHRRRVREAEAAEVMRGL
jgi:hypothetical protein